MFADARAHKARIAYPAASLPRVQLPTLNDVVRVCCLPLLRPPAVASYPARVPFSALWLHVGERENHRHRAAALARGKGVVLALPVRPARGARSFRSYHRNNW